MITSTNSWCVATATAPSAPPKREAAGVAHEDRRGRRVEPQEGEARADDRQAQHGQVADAQDVRDAEIFGEARVADEIGDQQEGDRRR